MKDKITCFKLNWYDCGLCCADDMVQEEITVYRNNNLMVFKELNGYGVICSCEIIHIEPVEVEKLFDFLERIYDKWENDYKVEVCDGSEWKVRMWHSSHKIKTVSLIFSWEMNTSTNFTPNRRVSAKTRTEANATPMQQRIAPITGPKA